MQRRHSTELLCGEQAIVGRVLFRAQTAGQVDVKSFNITGKQLRSFEFQTVPDEQSMVWDGNDESGKLCPSGNYFPCLQNAHAAAERIKLTLLK